MLKMFKPGNSYSFNYPVGGANYIRSFEVIKRTAKTITIEADARTINCTVYDHNGREVIYPLGKYAMAPVLKA